MSVVKVAVTVVGTDLPQEDEVMRFYEADSLDLPEVEANLADDIRGLLES